ncbi:hypothetical protein CKO11_14265 [Rhodobacter sp. TJ_12]|uniref:hypothetical protein n=1 Tax=Rhodobacter sp. TJ_12 TaxID=2029399 RepID=UPI001CBA8915|nr:hypothetical protein [Rhodobacter sp. TJ_12]MBZ4023616.1 hypothetical protein [Rhodobacter sp. TJ_12]
MWGPLIGYAGMASLRMGLALLGIGIWLMSRPGGWAVVVVAILVGVKLLPDDGAPADLPLALPSEAALATPTETAPAEPATQPTQ